MTCPLRWKQNNSVDYVMWKNSILELLYILFFNIILNVTFILLKFKKAPIVSCLACFAPLVSVSSVSSVQFSVQVLSKIETTDLPKEAPGSHYSGSN